MQVARSLQNPEVSCMELPSDSQATPKRLPNLPLVTDPVTTCNDICDIAGPGHRPDITRTSGCPDLAHFPAFSAVRRWDTVGHGGTFCPNKYGSTGKYGTNPNPAARLELMPNYYNALIINNHKDG